MTTHRESTMYGFCASVWGLMSVLEHGGELWTVRSDDQREPVVFTGADAATRFARIIGRAEGRDLRPMRLEGQALSEWLEALSSAEVDVLLEPEYVAGDGIVGNPLPATEIRAAVGRAPIPV